ncbi:MAG: addiction module protein [Phycisphaeraceae bacterium]
MKMTLTEVEQLALSLSPNERELLATRLLSSLDEVVDQDDLPPGWKETVLARKADMDSGRDKGIQHDKIYDEIRGELGWK